MPQPLVLVLAVGLTSRLLPLAPRVVLLELPGHGRSPDPVKGPLGAREYGAVVIACVAEMFREQGGKVALVGNSLGGALSLFAAHERPDLCAGVDHASLDARAAKTAVP